MYWTYELCHGKHIRQYHEERDGKVIKMQEYILGTFTKEMMDELVSKHEKDVANGITRHPPTKKIEGVAMPYYEITMTGGTKCDLTQLPRYDFVFMSSTSHRLHLSQEVSGAVRVLSQGEE